MTSQSALPVNTLAELIRLAKEKPGTLHYASSGIGGPNHLAGELLANMAGIDIVHVPFKGTGAAIPATLGGEPPLLVAFIPGVAGYVQSKRLKALAVAGSVRTPRLPDVPTMAEAGVPGYDMTSFIAALAPPATPPAILDRLQAAFAQALREPATEIQLGNAGFDTVAGTRADLGATLAVELEKYRKLMSKLDIKE